MGQASQGKAEQQFGDTIIPAEPADWNTVEKLATSLLGRTKDLRVMLALTHATGHVVAGWQVTPTGYCWCRKPCPVTGSSFTRCWKSMAKPIRSTASTPSPG